MNLFNYLNGIVCLIVAITIMLMINNLVFIQSICKVFKIFFLSNKQNCPKTSLCLIENIDRYVDFGILIPKNEFFMRQAISKRNQVHRSRVFVSFTNYNIIFILS